MEVGLNEGRREGGFGRGRRGGSRGGIRGDVALLDLILWRGATWHRLPEG